MTSTGLQKGRIEVNHSSEVTDPVAARSPLGSGDERTRVGRLSGEGPAPEKTTAEKPENANAAIAQIKMTLLLSRTFCLLRHSFPVHVRTEPT